MKNKKERDFMVRNSKTYKVALGKRHIKSGELCIIVKCHGDQRAARKFATDIGYTVSGVKAVSPEEATKLSENGIKLFTIFEDQGIYKLEL